MHSVRRATLPVYVDTKAKFPHFSLPMLVGYFSLDSERQFHADVSQLRYVYFPRHNENLAWDLNVGLENVQRASESKKDERIDHLLRGVLSSGISMKPEVAGFVCFRGLLTTIMTTPYEQSQGWEILVSKYKGILYMCAREMEEKRRRSTENEGQKRFSSWGFKFEQYLMTETPNQAPDVHKPVKEGEEFCCMYRTKLNNHRILFGAEMDGVRSKEPLPNSLQDLAQAEFVELKTSRRFDKMRQEQNFKRYKLLKWWAQSFLVGIKNIVCGFRDDNGIVDNIRFYPLQEIPKLAKDMWVPAVCMTFLDQFLTFVETTVNNSYGKNDPNTVWRFRWEPGVQFVTADEFLGQSNFSFLPEWFLSTTPTVDHHPPPSGSADRTPASPPTEPVLANSFLSATSTSDRAPSNSNPLLSSTSNHDHTPSQEFLTSATPHDPFSTNSFMETSNPSSDQNPQQPFVSSSSCDTYLSNTSSLGQPFLPTSAQSILNSSKSLSSFSYLSPPGEELLTRPNHLSSVISSSHSYLSTSSVSMSQNSYVASSSSLPCHSDLSSSTVLSSPSFLSSSADLPSHSFISSTSAVDQVSSHPFLPADRLSTDIFLPSSEHLPPHS